MSTSFQKMVAGWIEWSTNVAVRRAGLYFAGDVGSQSEKAMYQHARQMQTTVFEHHTLMQ